MSIQTLSPVDQEINETVAKTISHMTEHPEEAKATFTVRSTIAQGFVCKSNIRNHEVTTDEPEDLGGSDAGPNPVEHALNALATCQELTVKAHAGQLGIHLEDIEVKVSGDIDLKGFFAIDDTRPGFQNVTFETTIKTDDADPEKLEQLKQRALNNCPVQDIIKNATPVQGEISFTS